LLEILEFVFAVVGLPDEGLAKGASYEDFTEYLVIALSGRLYAFALWILEAGGGIFIAAEAGRNLGSSGSFLSPQLGSVRIFLLNYSTTELSGY